MIQFYDIGVYCGKYCLGGTPSLEKTEYPDGYSVAKYDDVIALQYELLEAREAIREAHRIHPFQNSSGFIEWEERPAVRAALADKAAEK